MKSLILLLVLVCSTTRAAEPFKLELKTDFKPVALAHENKPGVWFNRDDAEYLLKLRTGTLPALVELINQYSIINDKFIQQVVDLKVIIAKKDEQIKSYQDINGLVEKRLAECQASKDSWYNSKLLWTGVGAVLGISGTVAIVHYTR